MKRHPGPWTPHGESADRQVGAMINRVHRHLLESGRWHPTTLSCWVVGPLARGEGWIVRPPEAREDTWDLLDPLTLVLALPPGFEDEARTLEHAWATPEVSQAAGGAVEVLVVTRESLPRHPVAIAELARGRRVVWSFGDRDPIPEAPVLSDRELAALELRLASRDLGLLAALLSDPLHAFQPALVRETWSRLVYGLDRLGRIVLLASGCFDPKAGRRTELVLEMARLGSSHPELARLVEAAGTIRSLPVFKVPGWGDLVALGQELVMWHRYVAHVHLGGELVPHS